MFEPRYHRQQNRTHVIEFPTATSYMCSTPTRPDDPLELELWQDTGCPLCVRRFVARGGLPDDLLKDSQ